MRKIGVIMLSLMIATSVSACSPNNPPPTAEIPEKPGGDDDHGGSNHGTDPSGPGSDDMSILIKVGSATFEGTLADNVTAREFKALLPMTVTMNELNRNEKYYGLPVALSTAAYDPGTIRNGDIMLYGPNTIVLFYKTFPTSYNYSRIGTIDNPSALESALGAGSVRVTFE